MTNFQIQPRLTAIKQQLKTLESRYQREQNSVRLIAVSKTRSADEIRTAADCRQLDFGENYVQEAVDKITQLEGSGLTWHFIGPIQKNKTKLIAQHFDWVHSIDREVIATRLNDQRPQHMPPINACLQINIDREESKSGLDPKDALAIAQHIDTLPQLSLQGLMAIPAPQQDFKQQRATFSKMRLLLDQLNNSGFNLTTLSMGMSNDFEAAVAEGATMVRIGTAIFGPRN